MFTIKIAEDVSAQTICLLIQVSNVYNVPNQVTGTQIKEDAFSVQTNKSMTGSEEFALHARNQLLFSKIMNATLAHKTLIMTRLE